MTQPIIAAIDIDGTLCDSTHLRDRLPSNPWGDYGHWEEEITMGCLGPPHSPFLCTVSGAQEGMDALITAGALIVLVTTRHDGMRWYTRHWLDHVFPSLDGHGYGLLMRPQGDYRMPQSLREHQLVEIQRGLSGEIWYVDDFPVQTLLRTFRAPEEWATVVALCKGEV